MVYDEHGQLLNASFMDFLMPYATEVPVVEIDHLSTPSPLNPLGIKGAGEAGVIPGMAVIAAAIEDAEAFVSPDGHLAVRAVSPAPAPCRRGDPGAAPYLPGGLMKVTGSASIAAPRDEGVEGAQRPRSAGADDSRRLAAGGDRHRRLSDDDLCRRGVDQGHLPGRGPAGRAAAARLDSCCAPPAPARREPSTPTAVRPRRRMGRLASTTTRTRWSAA